MNKAVLFLFAFAALWTALVSLVTINRLKDIAVPIVLRGGSVAPMTLLRALGSSDAALAAAAAVAVGLLAWLELEKRAVSCFLRTASATQAFIALTILAAWTGHAYLSPGVLLGGDTATHISRFLEVARGIEDGALPTWTNNQYLGEPLLWFTGPLTYVVGGFITVITGDAVVAIKIFLFASHIAAAWLFFALMRRLDFRPVPAMIASAGFAGCFAHLHLFLFRGVVPQAATIVALVLLFHAAEGLMAQRGRPWVNWLLTAAATAALIVNHQPHALFAAFYLAVFGAVSLLLGRWHRSGLPRLVLAALCGVIMSTVAVLPFVKEADQVMIDPQGFPFLWHAPTLARLAQLFLWRDTRTTWGFDYWAYLGITLIVIGIIGLWTNLRGTAGRRRQQLAIATGACLAFSLFLYNPVVRDVIFIFFPLAILVGMGIERLDRRPSRVLLIVTTLVLIDIGSTSIQPLARNDKAFATDAGQLLERQAPNDRIVEIDLDAGDNPTADVGPDAGPAYYYATVQRIAGNHNMAATHVHNYAVATAKLAEGDLRRDKELSVATRHLLELLDVTRVICLSPIASGCPADFAGTEWQDGLGRVLKLDGIPVLFSQKLVELQPPPELDKPMLWTEDFSAAQATPRIDAINRFLQAFLDVEQPDPVDKMGAAIAVRHLSELPVSASQGGNWRPHVINHDVGLERVAIRIESDGAGYAQIAHPWFPATRVMIDGQIVQPIQGSINLVVIPVHRGINDIELQPGTTPIRLISEWISLAGLLLTAAGAFYLRRKESRFRPRSRPPWQPG